MVEGVFLDVMKVARTVPAIHKKGPRYNVVSYRPVSLIPVLA